MGGNGVWGGSFLDPDGVVGGWLVVYYSVVLGASAEYTTHIGPDERIFCCTRAYIYISTYIYVCVG